MLLLIYLWVGVHLLCRIARAMSCLGSVRLLKLIGRAEIPAMHFSEKAGILNPLIPDFSAYRAYRNLNI